MASTSITGTAGTDLSEPLFPGYFSKTNGSTGLFWNYELPQTEYLISKEELGEEKENILIKETYVTEVPKIYFTFFTMFLCLTIFLGTLILVSTLKSVTIIDPFLNFYGFIGSLVLTITNFVGIRSKREKDKIENQRVSS